MKIKKFILLILVFFSVLLPIFPSMAAFDYEPMERIPGTAVNPTNFCGYIQAVYKFGIWTVGIAAMFMIMFGGYTYLLSAGNKAGAQKAKGFIADAIMGIVMALTAYIVLYEINPDLLRIAYFCT